MLLDQGTPRTRPAAAVAAKGDAGATPIPLVALGVIRLVNFRAVRRRLGIAECNALMGRLAAALADMQAGVSSRQCGQGLIEVGFAGALVVDFKQAVERLVDVAAEQLADVAHTFQAGLALAGPGDDELAMLERAEGALSQTSATETVIIALEQEPPAVARHTLSQNLVGAASRGEFYLVYQPKIHVRNRSVTSAEALIRWQHPRLGLIMPDAFIGLADTSGEIRSITLWTLRKVISDQEHLSGVGHHLRVFINVSGGLLTDRSFIDEACEIVGATGASIGFEITETAVINDPDLAISNLERCTAAGISLAIDDYGSGLSSLAYLKRLPASELKIDKMFVTQLTSSHRDPLIVRSTIDLAHALDMEVTAEGVETPAALALLTVMGCEMVQGYLISPPLKLDEFKSYLQDYRFQALESDEKTVVRPASFWKRA